MNDFFLKLSSIPPPVIFRFCFITPDILHPPMFSSLDSFITSIQQYRTEVPKEVSAKIHEIASKAIEEMSKEAGMFFHEKLDDNKHTEKHVKAIIALFPESLSQLNKDGNLPIQTAVISGDRPGAHSSVSFVPMMAREGCHLGIGGKGSRGGLLSDMPTTVDDDDDDDDDMCTMECLASAYYEGEHFPAADEYDHKRKQVLKELRGMNLLRKNDIEEYGLLIHSICSRSLHRFGFLLSWDPQSLDSRDSSPWWPPIHVVLTLQESKDKEESFEMALKAGMKHFPERLGFLFYKAKGITACRRAFDEIGVEKAMHIIRKCIPPSSNHLILHHSLNHAPDLVDTIAQYYPDAAFLRNNDGQTLSEFEFYISLRRGRRTFRKQSTFFINATDDQLNSADPKSGLFPFMSAAVGDKSDLTAVYYLLSRNPKLVELGGNAMSKKSDEATGSRKRRREDIS